MRRHFSDKVVNSITFLLGGVFIVGAVLRQDEIPMLFLFAIVHLAQPAEAAPNDLLAQARLRAGHVGLTLIALVFVLVTFWQR
jgi:hypothetical protein